MTVKHVLNEQLLMGYAAGILPEAFNVVVAAHLSLSDESRAMLGCYEAVGGCVMEECECVDLGADALSDTLSRIKSAKIVPKKIAKCGGVLPQPLHDYVGNSVDTIKWKPLGGGVKQSILPTKGKATARLLFIPAGQAVPDHGHRGTELTLVLQGSFSDEVDHFARGDICLGGLSCVQIFPLGALMFIQRIGAGFLARQKVEGHRCKALGIIAAKLFGVALV